MEKQKYACPSATNSEGASLFGIVGNDGLVKFLPHVVPLDAELISAANSHSNPEAKFRYTQTCAEGGCRQWTGHKCGVIDKVLGMETEHLNGKIQNCPILNDCRWYAQDGTKACKVCPLVVADMI
ncbi:MAG TPA: hypothetical protein VK175_09320 [Leadbetterella sp.]|nr:hypothetical protein [Leadbetterella sp.]